MGPLPLWIERLSLVQVVLAVIGVPSLIALVLGGWRRVVLPSVRFIRRVNAALETVERIRETLGPNGGKSLYDKVAVASQAAQLSQARQSAMLDVVVDRPIFEADANGDFTWVNAAFERTFETSCDDMAHRGFINIIMPEARQRFVEDWHHAVADDRAFYSIAWCVTQRGSQPRMAICRWSAQPIRDKATGEAIAWMGAIEWASVPSDPEVMG